MIHLLEQARSFAAVDLEIGCGVGWHPIRYARQNPDRMLLAFERTSEKFGKFERRITRHREAGIALGNLRPFHADALEWLAAQQPGPLFSRVWILYPNPYPKPKHRDRRWFSAKLMEPLRPALLPQAEIRLATNLEAYAREAVSTARADWGLELLSETRLDALSPPPGGPRTHFEKKYLGRGEPCWDLCFRVKAGA